MCVSLGSDLAFPSFGITHSTNFNAVVAVVYVVTSRDGPARGAVCETADVGIVGRDLCIGVGDLAVVSDGESIWTTTSLARISLAGGITLGRGASRWGSAGAEALLRRTRRGSIACQYIVRLDKAMRMIDYSRRSTRYQSMGSQRRCSEKRRAHWSCCSS